MAWRIIGIENPARLSVRGNQLVIAQDETVSLPIEDIDTLIIDSYGVTLTTNLLAELAFSSTTVIVCDDKHMPTSVLLPYSQHSRQAKVSRMQLAMSQPFKKQLWQRIITQKITNQADVLDIFNLGDDSFRSYTQQIKSGDSTNRESIAARLYFDRLLGDFTRRQPIWHNAALNFGYAIIRSHIARHIAARGLIASQGIFHRSELNSFNLADDIIEAYRPAVDFYVLSVVANTTESTPDYTLTKEDRQKIVDIMNFNVIIDYKKFTLKYAIEKTVESFVDSIATKEAGRLLLPQIDASLD